MLLLALMPPPQPLISATAALPLLTRLSPQPYMMASDAPPQFIFTANAATKWVVTAAQTGAVIARRDLVAPFVVVGSIGAAFATKALKKAINQQRPDGAPFTDPGMPSSHALVATFAAAAWAAYCVATAAPRAYALLLLGAAACVSWLRVATGYHTWAQIGVGAGLGAVGALGWMAFGAELLAKGLLAPRAAATAVYTAYVGGSVLFVAKSVRKWSSKY